MVGDRQEFIVTLDKHASMLNCSATQPHAEITKLRKPKSGGRTYAHDREEGAPKIELTFVESNKNELFFTCAEKIGGGTYRLDFSAMMPNGEELDAKGIVFSVTNGTVDYIIKIDRIGQVHDHLEIYIELEFNSTAPDSFQIDFLPRETELTRYLQKRLSFFSGHTHLIEPGLTVHTISLAIPLHCKEFVEMIETGNLCFRIQSELEEFEFNPLNLDLFSGGEIICFAMYTPDWRDKENFKPSANHLKSELEKPRGELVYELQFQPHMATTLRAKLPPKAIDKVEVIKVRGGKKTDIQFVVPALLDLQEHNHFFRNTTGIKRMIQLASEMECMKEDEWYYLRIKAISEDLYDPLEVFIRTRFLVCDKHIFPSEYSIIRDVDFLPHIGNYALHRMKLTELAKDHDIPTQFFIPDEIFQGDDEIDSGVVSNLDDWVAERKTIIDKLEDKLASLDERISDK